MKKLLTLIALISAAVSSWAQNDFGRISLDRDMSLPIPTMEAEKSASVSAAQKEWTIMVFLNAKNNLEKFGIEDMNEMERIGSNSKMNVVVEMGRMEGYDSSNGDWKGVRRFYIENDLAKDPFGKTINSPMIENLGSINMGDYKEVIKFVRWAKTRYPAKKYMLILWNHGGGWTKDNPVADKGISYDEETGNNIDTPQLGKIVREAGKLDILASDACLMQMAEIAAEVRGGVDYLVGSEETEPGAGYTYYKILAPLAVNPYMTPEALSKIIVLAYWDSNLISSGVATHSVIKMSEVDGLMTRMDAFAKAAMASGEKAKIKEARDSAQKYAIDDNKDLKHFADLTAAKVSNQALKAAAQSLSSFISSRLIIENKTSIIPSSNSNGIAVYAPASFVDGDYGEIKLATETKWDEFLKWMVAK
ncbi:MAG: hypothetical protein GX447_09170 [Elusimicrobia bacterium]|nr:hypothetical protein [Elusimicrobiota bacterium]